MNELVTCYRSIREAERGRNKYSDLKKVEGAAESEDVGEAVSVEYSESWYFKKVNLNV